jgi:hypothetical protein
MKNKIHLFKITSCTLLLLLVACQKEPVHRKDQVFVGSWQHRIDQLHAYRSIRIGSDSRGWLDVYNADGKKTGGGDQSRKWLHKKDYLYFGWLGMGDEKYHIDQYPKTAAELLINGFDTIPAGEIYLVMDGDYYRRF